MQIGTPMSLFEFGNSGTDPLDTIYPESVIGKAITGVPTLLCAGFISPPGITSTAKTGEPYLFGGVNLAHDISPPGITSTVQIGEPYLAGAVLTAVNPTISNVMPVGGNIGTQQKYGARLTLGTANGVITRIIINVEYPTGTSEEAFIDGVFTPDYSGMSTIAQSSPGVFDITMIRNGGWPSSPRIRLHANTDRGGMTQ